MALPKFVKLVAMEAKNPRPCFGSVEAISETLAEREREGWREGEGRRVQFTGERRLDLRIEDWFIGGDSEEKRQRLSLAVLSFEL